MSNITTPRLTLTPVTLADAPFIQANFADDSILRWMRHPVPYPVYPEDGAITFLEKVVFPQREAGTHFPFIIRRAEDATPMGSVGVKLDTDHTWEMGFWLAGQFRGKGYMPEAVIATMRWLFKNTTAEVLEISNAVSNDASAAVQQKTRCDFHGVFPANPPYHCGDTENDVWSMSRQSFIARHGL